MAEAMWRVDSSDGELRVRTGVTGRAAKMGHRLVIAMNSWAVQVSRSGDRPVAAELTVEVDSLEVLTGEGGLTPLSGPEKTLVRSNALKCLHGDRYPRIVFRADDVAATDAGYRLTGVLTIHGRDRPHTVDVRVSDLGDSWRLECDSEVRQTAHGIKPYSMMMGALKVADPVTVSCSAVQTKP